MKKDDGNFDKYSICCICKKAFKEGDVDVKDHDHIN